MSVRIRSQITLVAATDSDEKNCQFNRSDKTLNQVIETFDCESSGEIQLSPAQANYTLPMGVVTAGKILYIETDRDITVKLDGEATGHHIGAPTTGYKARLYIRSSFSDAPIVTNEDATNPAVVGFFIAGDA